MIVLMRVCVQIYDCLNTCVFRFMIVLMRMCVCVQIYECSGEYVIHN